MRKVNCNILKTSLIVLLGFSFFSCEQEDILVGNTLFGPESANLNQTILSLESDINVPDSLRSDEFILDNAVVGVYDEPIFGKTKSDFYTQVRLNSFNPTFDESATIDSIVLRIPAFVKSPEDTLNVQTDLVKTTYTTDHSGDCTVTDTLFTVAKYYKFKTDSLYGNLDQPMNIQVHRVTEFMESVDSTFYSDRSFEVGELWGETEITNTALIKEVKQLQEEGEFNGDDALSVYKDSYATYSIRLDGAEDFFETNVIQNSTSPDLSNQISFVKNLLNGIRISTNEDNGFLLTFVPRLLELNVYYSEDNPDFSDANNDGINDNDAICGVSGTEAKINKRLSFDVSQSDYITRQEEISNELGSLNYNSNTNIFAEGMAGTSTSIRINEEELNALQTVALEENRVITDARILVYTDSDMQGGLPLPEYLHVYNSDKTLLDDYGATSEYGTNQALPFVLINKGYNHSKGRYELNVTQQIKNIVEDNFPNRELTLEVGNYINVTGLYYTPRNAFYTNRVYNPYRFIGYSENAMDEDKRLRLVVTYAKK